MELLKQNISRMPALEGFKVIIKIGREIRHTIANDFYVDIDIKNAHPVILAHLCSEIGVSCKWLKKYNKKRDTYLKFLTTESTRKQSFFQSLMVARKPLES
jgi:hypothetical protein